jgi:hypothetical protein
MARLALPPNHVTTPSPQPALPNSPTGPHTHGLRRLPWRDLASILDWSTAVIAQPRTQTCTWVLRVCFLRSQHAWPECLAPCPRVRLVAFYKSSGSRSLRSLYVQKISRPSLLFLVTLSSQLFFVPHTAARHPHSFPQTQHDYSHYYKNVRRKLPHQLPVRLDGNSRSRQA